MPEIGTSRTDEALTRYLAEIASYPLLTADEELELGKRSHAGDTAARERLVVCNLRLVVHIAKTYHTREMTLLDLIQEGTIGLMRAAEKFAPRANARFATYARYWIRRAIGRAIAERDRAIPLPEYVYQDERHIRRVAACLTGELGRTPTDGEIAEAAGVSLTIVQRIAALPPRQLASLDAPLAGGSGDGETSTLGDYLADNPDGVSMEEQAEQHEERNHLYELLRAHLAPRELAVLALRYRLGHLARADTSDTDDTRPLPYRQVAAALGISGEMARLIEGEALTKLRQALSVSPDGILAKRTKQTKRAKATAPQPAQQTKTKRIKQLSLFGDVA